MKNQLKQNGQFTCYSSPHFLSFFASHNCLIHARLTCLSIKQNFLAAKKYILHVILIAQFLRSDDNHFLLKLTSLRGNGTLKIQTCSWNAAGMRPVPLTAKTYQPTRPVTSLCLSLYCRRRNTRSLTLQCKWPQGYIAGLSFYPLRAFHFLLCWVLNRIHCLLNRMKWNAEGFVWIRGIDLKS